MKCFSPIKRQKNLKSLREDTTPVHHHTPIMFYNKRLHARRPGEHGDHFPGCALHDIEHQHNTRTARSSLSPLQSNGSSRYSSLSSLNQRKSQSRHSTPSIKLNGDNKRNSLGDNSNNSNSSVLSNSSIHDSDDSLSRFKAAVNGSGFANRSKSVTSLNSRASPQKQFSPVQIKSCDSPDHIIATLFPVTEFQTGGKGKCLNRSFSHNVTVNGTGGGGGTDKRDYHYRNIRAKSTSSDNSSSLKSRTNGGRPSNGRLLSVERDFENLRY